MIKFLHAADLHLDAPFAALSPEQAAARRQEQRELLNELAEAANTHDCDLVLLAGDLFDSAGASDETLLALRRALASIRAPVFISPGNHDCLLPGSAYLTERWPENVHIFKTDAIEAVELPEKQLRVYGAGFTARHERPLLEGFRAKADGWTNLMVLHGDATQAASPYNPITPEQLAASGLAYLALGHIHQASGLLRCGSTYYAWPGCAMGRGFDELGQKGAYLGEVSDSGVRLDLLPLHGRSYEILRVEAGDDALAAVTAALPEDTQNDIYRVILTGEAEPVETATLQAALAPPLRADHPRRDAARRRSEGTEAIRRLTVLRALKARYDAAQTGGRRESRWPRAAAARRWTEGRRRNEASAHDRDVRQT
ncbi:MAG: metallophosphoesterase family protein [Oscillospiraceae bacterium]